MTTVSRPVSTVSTMIASTRTPARSREHLAHPGQQAGGLRGGELLARRGQVHRADVVDQDQREGGGDHRGRGQQDRGDAERGPRVAPDGRERPVQDLADAEGPQRDHARFRRLGLLALPAGIGRRRPGRAARTRLAASAGLAVARRGGWPSARAGRGTWRLVVAGGCWPYWPPGSPAGGNQGCRAARLRSPSPVRCSPRAVVCHVSPYRHRRTVPPRPATPPSRCPAPRWRPYSHEAAGR